MLAALVFVTVLLPAIKVSADTAPLAFVSKQLNTRAVGAIQKVLTVPHLGACFKEWMKAHRELRPYCGGVNYLPENKTCEICQLFESVPQEAKGWHFWGVTECKETGKYCSELYRRGVRRSGVYTISSSDGLGKMEVYCDMVTDGGGWTVFQRRHNETQPNEVVVFWRDWADYKRGFGNLTQEFWLGNDNIHRLTQQAKYELRVDLEDTSANKWYAFYSTFSVASETLKYNLTIGGYSGDAGDAMGPSDGSSFTTRDRDNDVADGTNCAVKCRNAGWYWHRNDCFYCLNLNSDQGRWYSTGSERPVLRSSMKIRPVGFKTAQ